jgi:hypothetical protein
LSCSVKRASVTEKDMLAWRSMAPYIGWVKAVPQELFGLLLARDGNYTIQLGFGSRERGNETCSLDQRRQHFMRA